MGGAGFTVPGYLVDAPLGRGSAGEVWLGRVASSRDPVALKRLPLGHASQVAVARAEAALLAELDHPNLIRLHEFLVTGTDAVLVLDLAAGGSLAELIGARGSLTPGEVITALAPIASALAYLHDAGVVHGDVTPANILFTDDGQPMLADLGVSRLLGDQSTVRSTPAYIDPGVAAGFMPAPQSDVFMLGGVAVHALTGAPLWPGETAEDALFAALAANLAGLDDRFEAARVPGEMRAVLRRALAIEPARRGTAAEFALDLRFSDRPIAVELAAGRERVAPPDRAVQRAVDDTDEFARIEAEPVEDVPVVASVVSAVPVDDSPVDGGAHGEGSDEPAAGNPAQTHIAGPRPRPSGTHRYSRSRWRRHWARWAIAGGCVVAVAGGAVAWGVVGNGAKRPAAARVTPPTAAGFTPLPTIGDVTASFPGTASDTAPAVGADGSAATRATKPFTASQVLTLLAELDVLRERAYARRAPLLLTGVYEPGPLLDEDTATLDRTVPSGCGLEGVHTSYTNAVISTQTSSMIVFDVRATLAESVLFCNGVAKAKAAGSPPSTLHMTLTRSGSTTFLISAVTH